MCNLGNLSAGCTYSMRVRSGNAVGWGPTSPVVDVVTSPEEPGPPKDLEIVNRRAQLAARALHAVHGI